ncbi:MAG: hypothetical protein IPI55_15450 [Flavobacteriales bacterium]|nr:hypothetical protein [Flavobacteriales bacterium]
MINGYAKDIEGEVLSYFSVYPEHATTALLTRCTDGKKAIAWETAPVPHWNVKQGSLYSAYYFSWIAAYNSTTSGGDRDFDLFIDDQKVLTFTTYHSTQPGTWQSEEVDGVKLVFEYSKMDRHGDAHGFAHLQVPLKYIKLGEPLRLKIVGHAQDSPDWFMTFRYTFEEKVELEAMPFITAHGKQVIQVTAMHFGPPALLGLDVNGKVGGSDFLVAHGLNVFRVMVDAVTVKQPINVRLTISPQDRSPWPPSLEMDTTLILEPVIHRDIHLVHHSHTDIGYSHLQAEVETIQNNNIWKALELIDRTKDYPEGSRFVWNVESLWAVENFLGIASEADKQRFIAAVKSGSIALSANYANILTGLCTPEEMHWIVEYADSLRAWYGLPITMAMQTDIPGMSWSMVDAYAAHGIRHLSQGPNYIPDMPDGGDRIGSTLREQGDKPYWWKGTTGKDSILVWTAGQGYGGWHGFTAGAIKERGTRKIAAYMNELDAKRYPYDMVQWRYNIVSDNGPVDSTLSDFVRDWNEKYSSPRLIIANAGEMMQEFEMKYGKQIPTWSGDFTPYWEDGAYSTAKEEGDVRVLSARLTNLIDAAKILGKPIDPHLLYRAKRSIVMWHEHTWGAWCSISDPDAHFTTDQWRVKKAFADSAGWYVNAIEEDIRRQVGPETVAVGGGFVEREHIRWKIPREIGHHAGPLERIRLHRLTGSVTSMHSGRVMHADTSVYNGIFEWCHELQYEYHLTSMLLIVDSSGFRGEEHYYVKQSVPGCSSFVMNHYTVFGDSLIGVNLAWASRQRISPPRPPLQHPQRHRPHRHRRYLRNARERPHPRQQQRLLLRPALDRCEQRQHGRHHRMPARRDLGGGRDGGRAQGEPWQGHEPRVLQSLEDRGEEQQHPLPLRPQQLLAHQLQGRPGRADHLRPLPEDARAVQAGGGAAVRAGDDAAVDHVVEVNAEGGERVRG